MGLSNEVREISEAKLYDRIDKIEVKSFGDEMLLLIEHTHVNCGIGYDSKMVLLSHRELISELRKYFGYLTLPELKIIFKIGYKNELGDFYGLNNKTYFGWIKSYLQKESRLKAIKAIDDSKKELLPKPKELTPEEKEEIIKKGVMDKFSWFKETGGLEDFGNVSYNYLDSKGLIDFTLDRKKIIFEKAKERLKHQALNSTRSTTMEKHMQSFLTDDKIKSEAKKIALKEYFEQLIEMGEEIKL